MKTDPPGHKSEKNSEALGLDDVLLQAHEANGEGTDLRDAERNLLDMIDGVRTVEEILRKSQGSWFVAMRHLRSLHERGLVTSARLQRLVMAPAPAPVDGPQKTEANMPAFSPTTLSAEGRRTLRPGFVPVAPSGTFAVVPVAPIPVVPQPALASEGTPGPGQKSFMLGRYEVLSRIGQGGTGSVYLCRQAGPLGFDRLYTIKVIREHAAKDSQALRSLEREAELGGRLTHPNLVSVLDSGEYKNQPYLVMEYVEGSSLVDLLDGTKGLPGDVVVSVMIDVLRGLHFAHELADADGRPLCLVHGDVSPHNILLGVDGVARLADFGTARIKSDLPPLEPVVQTVGKPGYQAPEQLLGEPVDRRADIFAAGVTMWTALTGKKLFVDQDHEATVMNVLRRRIELPSAHGAPTALDDICLTALTRSPEGRFQTAEAMAAALEHVAQTADLRAPASQVGRWVFQHARESLDERRRMIRGRGKSAADLQPVTAPISGEVIHPTVQLAKFVPEPNPVKREIRETRATLARTQMMDVLITPAVVPKTPKPRRTEEVIPVPRAHSRLRTVLVLVIVAGLCATMFFLFQGRGPRTGDTPQPKTAVLTDAAPPVPGNEIRIALPSLFDPAKRD